MKERDDGIVIPARNSWRPAAAVGLHPSELHPSAAAGRRELRQLRRHPVARRGSEALSRAGRSAARRSGFDYPLSSRFDESDSYVVFDNVFVPWEHVFIYRNLELSRDQWLKTPSHAYGNHQAQVRYVTKLRFMAGLAQRMNKMTGNAAQPPVQMMIGEPSVRAATKRCCSPTRPRRRSRRRAVALKDRALFGDGVAIRTQRPCSKSSAKLAGLGLHHAALVGGRFRQSANLGDIEGSCARPNRCEERRRADALIWDFLGTEFGSRHQQYEKLYGGAFVSGEAERRSEFRLQTRPAWSTAR